MAKDYANYPTYKKSRSLPGRVWIMLGLAFTLFILGLGLFFLKGHNKQALAHQTEAKLKQKILETPAPKPPEPKFDFYNILPQDNVALSAQAAEEITFSAVDPATMAMEAATTDPTYLKKPLDSLLSTTPEQLASAEAKKQLTQEMSQLSNNTYLLILGNFQDASQAEQYQAQALLKGFPVQSKANQVNGSTNYQLFMGPYSSLDVASQAKKRLNSAGMQAVLLKLNL